MLKLWGLSWLTPNHHCVFYVDYPLTISTKARPRQWGRGRRSFTEAEACQWNTEAAGMRPRYQNLLPHGKLSASRTTSLVSSGMRPRYQNLLPHGKVSASRTTSLVSSGMRPRYQNLLPRGKVSASRTTSLVSSALVAGLLHRTEVRLCNIVVWLNITALTDCMRLVPDFLC